MAAMALHARAPPPVVVVWMKGLGYIIGCQISSVEQAAPIGITPPPKDLAAARMSGVMFQWSKPHSLPVRPMPVCTSSAISNTL
jgi:hypothetical protein